MFMRYRTWQNWFSKEQTEQESLLSIEHQVNGAVVTAEVLDWTDSHNLIRFTWTKKSYGINPFKAA